jgi:hypothetical protein
MRSILLLAVAATALAGCAGPRISYSDQIPPYSRQLVDYAAQSGEFTAVIVGNPFPSPADAEAMAAAIPWPGYFTRARVTTRPGPEARSNHRAVFVFNPAWRGPALDEVCRDPAAAATRPPGAEPTRVAATFCAAERAVSWLVAEGNAGTGPGDPLYRQLMGQVMLNLLPPMGPLDRQGDRDCGDPC